MVEPYDPLAGTGSLAVRELGVTAIPSSPLDVLGAAAHTSVDKAFPLLDTFRMFDETGAGSIPTPSPAQAPRADSGIAADLAARDAEEGRPLLLQPDEAKSKYGIKDRLSWSTPVYDDVAKGQRDRTLEQMARENIIEHREPGLLTGALARTAAGLVGGLPGIVDPLNIATAFLPIVPEARAALWAARYGLSGVAAKGVVEGAFGQALLTPLQYGISRYDQEDFGAADALMNIALGGMFGGGLHTGLHLFNHGLPITEKRIQDAPPEVRDAMIRSALASGAEGTPVNVQVVLDGFDAARAQQELRQWVGRQHAIDAETDTALGRAAEAETGAVARQTAREAAASRLAGLREEADRLRGELAAAREGAATAVDTVTRDRLDAISQELDAGPSAARRADLESEQRMLTEGAAIVPAEEELTRARFEAEATGLSAELRRQQARVTGTEAGLRRSDAGAATRSVEAERSLNAQATRLQSQQEVLRDMTERTIRRLAGRAEVELAPEEVGVIADRVLKAKAEDAPREIDAAINAVLARRGDGLEFQTVPATPPGRAGGEGTIRLYRGENSENTKGGGWFTTDPKKAALYGDVSFVDVSRADLAHFAQGHGGPDEWVTDNPKRLTSRLQRAFVQEGSRPNAAITALAAKHGAAATGTTAQTVSRIIRRIGPQEAAAEAERMATAHDALMLDAQTKGAIDGARSDQAETGADAGAPGGARPQPVAGNAGADATGLRDGGRGAGARRRGTTIDGRPAEARIEPGAEGVDPAAFPTAQRQIAAIDEATAQLMKDLETHAGEGAPKLADDPEIRFAAEEAAAIEDNARAIEQGGACLTRNT